MLGWRKLGAWFLVYAFVVSTTFLVKTGAGLPAEIPQANADLIMWVTGFFFGTNMLKPLFNNTNINLGAPK